MVCTYWCLFLNSRRCWIVIRNSIDKSQFWSIIYHCQFIINWDIINWICSSSCVNLTFTSRKVKVWSDSWCAIHCRVSIETSICKLGHHVIDGITKTLTLFCVSCVCCWCRDQCCWLSDFFLNCCNSRLDFSLGCCVCQFCLVVSSDINEQFCFWNVLIQDSFFILLACSLWSNWACWSCWIRGWFWVWTTCAFSFWLAIRRWILLAEWCRFWNGLWQFSRNWLRDRLWYWNWCFRACLSIYWRACRLLASWCYCWSFWSWRCTQYHRFRVDRHILISSYLAFQSWSCRFFRLGCISCHCSSSHCTRCCNPFKESLPWEKRCFFFNTLRWNWWRIRPTFNNLEKSKVGCRSTKPLLTRFDQFKTSHAICFTVLPFVPSKKHIYSILVLCIKTHR